MIKNEFDSVVAPMLSSAAIDATKEPAAVGVPEISPVDVLMLKPAGKPVAEKLSASPSGSTKSAANGVIASPIVPDWLARFDCNVGASFGNETTVIVKLLEFVTAPSVSVAVIDKPKIPSSVGVPLSCPVVVLKLRPAGREEIPKVNWSPSRSVNCGLTEAIASPIVMP